MNNKEKSRYARQIRLNKIGEAGQQKLLDSTVLIIGMGGLGSPAAMYLAAAGIGKLIVSDFDQVEDSNLQRQIIHRTQDIGELKAFSAKRTISELNPDCVVEALDWQLDDEELESYIQQADIVLDCTDNFPTRFAINRACVKQSTPLVSGAAIRMEGQITSYIPGSGGPCYQCLYKPDFESTETCAMEGVLAPVVGVIGTMQALQAILILIGEEENVNGKLLLFDALSMEWQKVTIPKNPNCAVCA
ncbi:HesA/MoeB/ThiF family protein [Cocleimonas sp. KMM 6892]|uniref:HesA/MoeB/ThiF family protein n=1 Tax=unclassified Cocleimonas TaxID=2639732 RepID=UPI002DBF62EB|nr:MULTISPECIES: HesA/MoeB/ThiF family protein [unclassified Cocleimonas]MEB8433098.1 HesA/MoeB/ThiF family protein [Cocleimonas sp. KMM 6892]MEC4715921.1 HesA/MoeB/ThiF family protein [Cocleimonas sp. KMM 6895]MEC4745382.1 HesA/MoeB/ThiF family protein [Cocleimonas sp. KMM 6896]